ncbi:beta-N-acetylhexosaminidase [uncultured Flavonifractor sp.]|uniref:Beta-N-acetylhexosaminidase n=2 Tax=Flavonifractor TaxID=946234 RepID=A0A9D2ML17_9FIRM|nr:beta-N-acetylhexosaminidase [uncultured Flavonifractor sp.]HJB80385.1 beta-N-acetylhexosaminidase [Candidatus Flavonifractor intestinigallinarum]
MMKRILSGILLLCVLGLTGCGSQTPAPTPTPAATPSATPTPTPEPTPTPDPVAEALAAMTTQEKVGQLLVAGIGGTEAGEDGLQAVQDYQVGGVILFGRNVESAQQLADLTNELKTLNGDNTPLFLCVDQEGGRVDRMPPEVDDLPSAYDYIAAGGDPLERGKVLAAQCAAFGFNLDFSTCLDIWSNPDNTVIGDRAYGSDPHTVTSAGLAVNQGLEQGGVIPVVKHFPGHGDTSTDSHVDLPVVGKTAEELEEFELIPFQAAIDQGTPCVMVAHILMTQIDPDLPASLSPKVVDGLLRQEMGFDGVVCTDDLTMGAISNTYGMGEAAVMAVEAGCDLLLVCHEADNLTAARDALLSAVDAGRISMERLDESVYRILSLKQEYGLTNDPVDQPDIETLNARIGSIS